MNFLPGIFTAFIIALFSFFFGQSIPLVGPSVLALAMGLGLNLVIREKSVLVSGLKFTSKTILRLAIILLGSSLSMGQIVMVGRYSLIVMVFTLTAAFGSGYLFGRLLNINWKMSTLISAGTGICGGSAIAAISPTIDADESDVAYSIAATFIFDMAMIVLFPIMGRQLGLSDLAYGLWTGTAVNDTSSVVAAGYAFSSAAGEFATIVKLTRTLSIIPIVLIFSWIGAVQKSRDNEDAHLNRWEHLRNVTPWFIFLFLVMAAINSMGWIPARLSMNLNTLSRFMMAMALGAIGFNTDLDKLAQAGINPMILGFIVSAIVVIVSLAVQFGLGQL